MGNSIELCGGTHVRSTGQLGLFRFSGQSGVAAGVRRIEAVTGPEAYVALEGLETRLSRIAEVLKANPEHLARRAEQLIDERQKLEARLQDALRAGGERRDTAADAEVVQVDGVQLTMAETVTEDRTELGRMAVAGERDAGKDGATPCWCCSAPRAGVRFTSPSARTS